MSKVADSIKIGGFTLKNRITFAPTVKFELTDETGLVTDALIEHYRERAKGGTGLICVEATAVLPGGRFGKNHMGLWDDVQINGHKDIVSAVHEYGAVCIIQLNHVGYSANSECGPAVGPSTMTKQGFFGPYETHGMTTDELHDMQKAYVDAAVRAQKAGYDGVQLHCCHGYLINQFMSVENNLRTDEYGGSPTNRARFATEIIKDIREKCGDGFLISVRTSGFEPTVEDAILMAEEYVAAGAQYLQVSTGMTDLKDMPDYKVKIAPTDGMKSADLQLEATSDEKTVSEEQAREAHGEIAGGYLCIDKVNALGIKFKEHFGDRVPVSCVGGLKTPEHVKFLIEGDFVDTVDVARAILADPDFANACLGKSSYVPCYSCERCQYGPFTKHTCPAGLKKAKQM